MKSVLSFCFLLAVLVAACSGNAPAAAIGAPEMSIMDRDLQIADWGVTIDSVDGQTFAFTTGAGGGTAPKVIVRVYNECRYGAVNRTAAGYFFGGVGTAVAGIAATPTPTSIEPNVASSISITFVEGIAQNALLYSETSAADAKVKMCVEIGLYDNEEANMVNFAEIELEYTVDLSQAFAALTGYTVSQANNFNNPNAADITFDGTLGAYFCNKTFPLVALVEASGISNQGSEISICFQIPDGQFEVKDIISLGVVDIGTTQLQQIIANTVEQNGTDTTPLAVTVLTDTSNTDTNVIVVSFLLYANFFDTAELRLAGSGSVLLEFGGAATSTRYLRKVDLRILQQQSAILEPFTIDQHEFFIEGGGSSSASSLVSSVVVLGASFLAAMAL